MVSSVTKTSYGLITIHAERAIKKTITWLLIIRWDQLVDFIAGEEHHFYHLCKFIREVVCNNHRTSWDSQRQTLRPYPYSWFTQPNCLNCTYMVVARHSCYHLPSSVKLAHVMDNWFVCIFVDSQIDMSVSHGVLQWMFTTNLHYIIIQVCFAVVHVHGYVTIWLCTNIVQCDMDCSYRCNFGPEDKTCIVPQDM